MVTDRKIIVTNGETSLDLTKPPLYVNKTEGFDYIDVQIVTSQGNDQDGATLINSYILPREMEIQGQIKANTTEEMQSLKDAIMNIFLPKKQIKLNHYYGGNNRVINVVIKRTPQFEFSDVSAVVNYTVRLKAVDPYWEDEAESKVQIANLTKGFHFPLAIPKNRGIAFGVKSAALIANVYNKSPVKVGMKFIFIAKGSVTNPQLFNVNTRQFFKLLCEMGAGETITVETGMNKTVKRKRNGVETDYIGKIDLAGGGSSFLELEPGNNLFRYAADGGEDKLEIKIIYMNRYVGV